MPRFYVVCVSAFIYFWYIIYSLLLLLLLLLLFSNTYGQLVWRIDNEKHENKAKGKEKKRRSPINGRENRPQGSEDEKWEGRWKEEKEEEEEEKEEEGNKGGV